MEFKEAVLSDLADITMGQSPKSEYYNDNSGFPFLQGNRTFGHIYPIIDTYTEKLTKLAQSGDIIMSVRAPVGDLNIAPVDLCIGRGLCSISTDKKLRSFVYYLLKNEIRNLENQSTGTIFNSVNKKTLEQLKVHVPSNLENQVKIGEFLWSLDEKIEVNTNIIANLEELSQTLFKRWLIDFEFPDENGNPYKSSGGKFVDTDGFMLPANWSVEPLDNIAQYTNGLAMQKYKPKDENDKLPVIKIKELKNGFVDDSSAFCTHSIPDKVKIFNGDIVFSWSATLLVDIWTGGPAGLNQHLFKVTSDKFQKWFYYYWTSFHNKNFIEIAKDKATTMGHINRKHLKEAKVFIPEEKVLQKLDYQMSLYLKEIVNINLQNKSLAELRDTLLPKLMSGEIELPDELEVDEHAELLQ